MPQRRLAERAEERGLDAADEPIAPLGDELAGAGALDGQLDLARTPALDLELDRVDEVQREPEAVEARRRCWRSTAGTSTVSRRPSISASEPFMAVSSPVAGSPAERPAHVVGPCIGDEQRRQPGGGRLGILEPAARSGRTRSSPRAPRRPSAARRRTPATDAADAGSQKMPSTRARSR